MAFVQLKIDSPIGELYLLASERGLVGVYWSEQPYPMLESVDVPTASSPNQEHSRQSTWLDKAQTQLGEYFRGLRKEFDLPFDLQGTNFQKRVWQALLTVPYGQTVSYSEIARRIENQKAVRAVGSANGKNPLCIIVPCHRVLPMGGEVGGYSGGPEIKAKLLRLERDTMTVIT